MKASISRGIFRGHALHLQGAIWLNKVQQNKPKGKRDIAKLYRTQRGYSPTKFRLTLWLYHMLNVSQSPFRS